MAEEGVPFYEQEYQQENSHFYPVIEISMGKTKKERIKVLVDTGCSAGIALFKEHIKKFNLDIGEKINDEPVPIGVADGHIIGADVYRAIVEINGEERTVEVVVIDPNILLGTEVHEEEIPLLGRDFLDNFDVLFKGKQKKVLFFKNL